MKVIVKNNKTQTFLGIEFPIAILSIDGKEVERSTEIKVLEEVEGRNGKILLFYNKKVIDVYIPTIYKQCRHLPVQQRKGCGPQNRHKIILYINGKLKVLKEFNDSSVQPDAWHFNSHTLLGSKLSVTFSNRYQSKESFSEEFDLSEYIEKSEDEKLVLTSEEAEYAVESVATHLGYDHCYDPIFPEGRKDVCAVGFMSEDGSTYGFDTIYLVWKNKDGEVKLKELTNSRSTKDYIHINSIEIDKDGNVVVKYGSGGSYSGKPWNESSSSKI